MFSYLYTRHNIDGVLSTFAYDVRGKFAFVWVRIHNILQQHHSSTVCIWDPRIPILLYSSCFCLEQAQHDCKNSGFKSLIKKDKPIFLKELKKIWNNEGGSIGRWPKGTYSASNTLLIETEPSKALLNPVTADYKHFTVFLIIIINYTVHYAAKYRHFLGRIQSQPKRRCSSR